MKNQTNEERCKVLAQEQRKKGAMLNWAEYQLFIIYKGQFEENWKNYQKENNEKKTLRLLKNARYYNNELNNLRVKAIKESVLPEKDKKTLYNMIGEGYLDKVRRLDEILLKMYDTKNQKSIFEEVGKV